MGEPRFYRGISTGDRFAEEYQVEPLDPMHIVLPEIVGALIRLPVWFDG